MIPFPPQKMDAMTFPAYCWVFGRFGWLSQTAVTSDDGRLDSGVQWWIHTSTMVMYRPKNSGLFRLKMLKHSSEASTCCCFWSTVSERGTHFEKTFSHGQMFMQNCENTTFRHLHDVSDLLQLQFAIFQDDFWAFLMFSGVTTSFGLPERSASSVLVRPHLNSTN